MLRWFKQSVAVAVLVMSIAAPGFAVEDDWWFGLWPECTKPIAQLNVVEINKCEALRGSMKNFTNALDKARAEEAAHPSTERQRCYAALPQFREGCDKRIEAEDARKRAKGELRAPPGTTSACAPPYRMTAMDGCQLPARRP